MGVDLQGYGLHCAMAVCSKSDDRDVHMFFSSLCDVMCVCAYMRACVCVCVMDGGSRE